MVLTPNIAALIGFACEAVLWGVYAVLFVASVILLLRRARTRTRSTNVPIFVANVLLFASCTAHFALEFNHFCTTLSTTGVAGFSRETAGLVGADVLISLSDFLGDLVLLYRCWVIWGKNFWIVLLPLLTATAGFGCILVVAHYILALTPAAPAPPAAIVPLGTAGYALPLATNVMVTALIVARLWLTARRGVRLAPVASPGPVSAPARVSAGSHGAHGEHGALAARDDERKDAERERERKQRERERYGGTARAARRAVAIIVESGALYLAAQAAFVVLFALGHPAEGILAVVAVQIYGIAPTLIVIRVALGISSDYSSPSSSSSPFPFPFPSSPSSSSSPSGAHTSSTSHRDRDRDGARAVYSMGGTEESARTTVTLHHADGYGFGGEFLEMKAFEGEGESDGDFEGESASGRTVAVAV